MNILENPFCVLGVSARDNRRRISESAEEKLFLDDSESVREARNVLTIPSRRLTAEIRWFPGIDDEHIRGIIEFFRKIKAGQRPGKINSSGFRGLALLNFAVSVFSFRKFRDVSEIEDAVILICRCFDAVSVEGICAVINNDRLIAGFTQADENDIVRELNDYRADILGMIDGKLSALTQNEYSGLAVRLAEKYSDDGGKSFLLGDIISACELKILPRLEELAEIIIDTDSVVKLSFTLREWKRLARPLIIAVKATGMENTNLRNQAEEIFYAIREKAVKLHNERNETSEALKLIRILKQYVADISAKLLDMANKDIRELESLEWKKQQAEKEYEEYKASIYYETEFGLIFKDKFRISADGILWKGVNTPLDEVEGISWGGIAGNMTVNYKIAIHTSHSVVRLSPNKKKYEEIIEHLWRALAGSISERILKQLQNGKELRFGSIRVKDNGCFLVGFDSFPLGMKRSIIPYETIGETYYQSITPSVRDSSFFGYFTGNRMPEIKFFTWGEVSKIWSHNGQFIIKSYDYSASASYIDDMNTHILEAIIRQHRGHYPMSPKLSSLLDTH